jgi:hypothetical protein
MIQLTPYINGKRVIRRIYKTRPYSRFGQWDTFAPKNEINYYNQSRSIPPVQQQDPQYWLNAIQMFAERGSRYSFMATAIKQYFQSLLPQYIECDSTLTPMCTAAQAVAVQPGQDYPYIGVPSGKYDYAPGELISYVTTENEGTLKQIISV